MDVRYEIEAAIASLCGDICTHYAAEENKTRAAAVAALVVALRWAPVASTEPEEVQNDGE